MSNFSQQIAALSPEQRVLLDKRLKQKGLSPLKTPEISKRKDHNELPLSFAQARLWFFQQLNPDNSAYNVFSALRIEGQLNVALLANVFTEIVRRHESLRTTFITNSEGQPIQLIAKAQSITLPIVDLKEALNTEQEVQRLAKAEAQRPFDLTKPLLRITLLLLRETEHILLLTMHHIVSDRWSLGVFVRDMKVLYKAFSDEQPSPLPELPIQYADWAIWQQQYLQGEVLSAQMAYWKQQLANLPVLELPTDRHRPAVATYQGAKQSFELSKTLSDALKTLSTQFGVTLFTLLLAAFKILLHKYTNQNDIVVGTDIANRNRVETEGLIGFLINTLVLRTNLSGNPTFRSLLNRVREVTLGAYDHQDLSFDKLVDILNPERNLSQMVPLFQVKFDFQLAQVEALELSELTISPLTLDNGTAKFEVRFNLLETDRGLTGLVEYNTDLFDTTTITRMVEHFQTLLEGIVANPEQQLSELSLLTEPEQHQLLVEWNDTQAEYPQDKCIHQLFESQVEHKPDAIALVFEDEVLTYQELNSRANQLAHHLCSLGVGLEVLVGICMERSLEMVVGLLGILKAGGAYISLDPVYPQQRLAFMLSDAQPPVLLTQQKLVDRLPEYTAQVVCLDTHWDYIAQQSKHNPVGSLTVDNPAYVIYTSGSTGQPKGVFGLHKGAVNRFHWMWQNYPFMQGEICCQKTSLNFVDSVWEIFGPLLQGVPTVIVPDSVLKDVQQFVATLARNDVTRLVLVPSLLRILLDTYSDLQQRLSKMKLWITSGEALSNKLLQQFQQIVPESILLNLYGSSEVSADVTCFRTSLQAPAPLRVAIGRPITNTQIYVLDRYLQPVPINVSGEVYVSGSGLARGYLKHPELTAEKFIPNPWSNQLGARLYKTGDLARYLSDGNIEYIGRLDYQVKIRGFRIELGEIEAVISQYPAVQEAVVVAWEDKLSSQYLVAYVALQSKETLKIAELRRFLESKLPNYMVPTAFVMLEALPLLPNGKINRRDLPAPDLTQLLPESNFVAPSTPVEEMLAAIWADVLGIKNISIHDNFFTLGGHSLLATRVVSQLRQIFEVELPLRRLFESPTVARLAKDIEKAMKSGLGLEAPFIKRISRLEELPLSFAQQRLWFLSQLEPKSPFYNIPAAIRLQGQLNLNALQQSFNEILCRHEALRTNFKTIEGRPIVVFLSQTSFVLPLVDLSELSLAQQQAKVPQLALAEAQQPFDFTTDLLLRVKLLRLSQQEHVALLTMHHIASDGWSIGVLVHEVTTLYQAFCSEQPSSLPELPIQYVDFAAWHRQWLQAEVLESQMSYWRKQLDGAPAVLELPTDRTRPAIQTFQGATYSFQLSQELSVALNRLSQQERCTLFMTLLAAFKTLLLRYTESEDIVVGSPIANRNRVEIERLIGFFVNTLVLRTNLRDNPTFSELLTRVREVALGAYAHQDLPFELLVEELQPQRDLSHTPLFQVMFVLQNAPRSEIKLPGLTLSPLASNSGTAKFDLTLYMTETAQGLVGALEYNTDLFEESTISRMAGHLQTLLEGIVANPQQHLKELPLLTQAEKAQLLEWNDTQADYHQQQCIHQLFEAQVERTPDSVAVVFDREQLTYCELNQRANQLAYYLRSLGVASEVLVGICVERSLYMVIGLLGILKAGGAYVPLDPAYPQTRLAFMLEDAQISVLLTHENLVPLLPKHRAKVVCLDADKKAITNQSADNPIHKVTIDNLAYVIYTSGSTGQPKGVQIRHSSVVNFLSAMRQTPGLTPEDIFLSVTTLSFDIAALEIYLPAIIGARLVLVSREDAADGIQLSERLISSAATVMQATPATWRLLQAAGWLGNRQLKILCGGEALDCSLAYQLLECSSQVWNLYGPTETTIWSAVQKVESHQVLEGQSGIVSIGYPIANTQFYILDPNQQLLPVGVPGELHIGGAGLARGYLNRPELTAVKFTPNPFRNEMGERLYKTGDLVRYRPDRTIEFLGRIDHQVKVRGFRIELGEIDAVLNQHPAMQQAVTLVREDQPSNKCLVTYIVQNPHYQNLEELTPETSSTQDWVSQWKSVWDQNYSDTFSHQDPTFNLAGWNSSYTGKPIPTEEMREWVEHTVERILELKPTHVLEIGCGTGLLLYRIAAHCSKYWGTDFSPAALDYIQQQLRIQAQPLTQVTLYQKEAHNFEGIGAEAFNAVILNSVVQYFPSIDYLLRVLEGAVRCVESGGFIFVGDVRSLPLLEVFHTSVLVNHAPSSLSKTHLLQQVKKRIDQEQELVIDPAFFIALKKHLPQISHVQISPKRGRHQNELTKFRYDVILHIGTEMNSAQDFPWLDWQEQQLTLTSVRQLLESTQPEILGLRRVPNARLLAEIKTVEMLSDCKSETVGDIKQALQSIDAGSDVNPEDLWALNRELPYTIDINWASAAVDGSYDVVLTRCPTARSARLEKVVPSFPGETVRPKPWAFYANNPLKGKLGRELVPQLRSFLRGKLPEYMVPSTFITLETLPLTPNGKVDRRALPIPDQTRPELEAAYQAPETEVEQTITNLWQEALHLEEIGIHDNFFDLGGHSLLLVQVHSKMQKIFQRDFPLVKMFQYPTVSHLARYLSQESSEQQSFTQHSHRSASRTASVQRRKQARKEHRAATKQKDVSSQ